ncbi:T9SS type A sorting domain-containing protein [Winogradskyella sp. A2]|uniref:T9SS type A sorting domain-containing protein n=1 Tax=Winogradskyella sp. A2 TaxID=3366944 RepID=UPI00398C3023
MKKITFLILMVLVSFVGSAQVILEDFDTLTLNAGGGATGDYGGFGSIATSLTTDGSDNVGEAINNAAGEVWQGIYVVLDTNFMDLSTNKTVTVDVFNNDGNTFYLTGQVELGQSGAATSRAVASHAGGGWQTMSFDFSAPPTGFPAADGEYGQFTIYTNSDSAGGNPSPIGALTILVDDITAVAGAAIAPPALPTVAAPTPPARAASDVVALYSDSYTQSTNWGQIDVFAASSLTDVTVDGNNTYQLTGAPGGGYQYNYFAPPGTSEDLSGMTHYHVDIWVEGTIAGGEVFTVQALNYDPSDAPESNNFYQAPVTSTGEWISIDVPISSFANADGNTNYNNIRILQIILQGPAYGPVFFDNLYFHNNQVLSTDEFDTAEFSVFPNPTNGEWNINSNSEMSKVSLFDILGKEVLTITPNATEATIDASTFRTGVYFARIEGVSGTKTVKLVRQ